MKNSLTSIFIFISCFCYGQNFRLFTPASKKLFTNYPIAGSAFSLAFDSVTSQESDSLYYNFNHLNTTSYNSTICPDWCGSHKVDLPAWLEKKIVQKNPLVYEFFNLFGDTLKFDFNLNIGDTSLFYIDATQRFRIIYEKIDTLTIMSRLDSARFYKIYHSTSSGSTINSALNGKEIIVSKNIGMVQFLQIDSFPQILNSVYLIGNSYPDDGLCKITGETLYDYQVGDEIQYRNIYTQDSIGSPWVLEYDYFIKYTILNKNSSADSFIYSAVRYFFDNKNFNAFVDTIILKYYRHEVIAQIPFEFYNGGYSQLHLEDYCGQKLWTYYTSKSPYVYYCPEDNCWVCFDTGGEMPVKETTYVNGLGVYRCIEELNSQNWNMFVPKPFWKSSEIIYFKKNGIECGSPKYLNSNWIESINSEISINPNPANEILKIYCPVSANSISLLDITGRLVFSRKNPGINEIINVELLRNGIYFAQISFKDYPAFSRKVVVLKN